MHAHFSVGDVPLNVGLEALRYDDVAFVAGWAMNAAKDAHCERSGSLRASPKTLVPSVNCHIWQECSRRVENIQAIASIAVNIYITRKLCGHVCFYVFILQLSQLWSRACLRCSISPYTFVTCRSV